MRNAVMDPLRSYDRFVLILAPGSPEPDPVFRSAVPGEDVPTRTGIVVPTVDDVGHYVDIGAGAIVAQSVVEWFCAEWAALHKANPDWTPEQVESAIDGQIDGQIQARVPTDGSIVATSSYQNDTPSGLGVARFNGVTSVISRSAPEAHTTIANKINLQGRLLSAVNFLLADLKTAGVQVDHWAINEIRFIAGRI